MWYQVGQLVYKCAISLIIEYSNVHSYYTSSASVLRVMHRGAIHSFRNFLVREVVKLQAYT